jgi:hypothetical protein
MAPLRNSPFRNAATPSGEGVPLYFFDYVSLTATLMLHFALALYSNPRNTSTT